MRGVLWEPRDSASAMRQFMQQHACSDYQALHAWSVRDPAAFWESLASYSNVIFHDVADQTLEQNGDMLSARWFPGATLNYAEHLLRHSGYQPALIFRGELGERQEISFDELRARVAAVATGLKDAGVTRGDRVAGYLPNCPEAIIAMLAASSMGAIWSSCSPDFGANGVVDRFGQIAPKVLFCADGYVYNGKTFDSLATVQQVLDRVDSIEVAVVISFTERDWQLGDHPALRHWDDFTARSEPLEFVPLPFDHPLFIMYSSGTTGAPKCIVHGHGGTLLQHLKEHVLHGDLDASDRLFYFTTCGWMMWNWLASGLATGATLVLFDGAPFANDGRILWQIVADEKVTVFGTSAKYLAAQEKAGVLPGTEFDLQHVRSVLSTGSPLAPASFDYVYNAVSADVQLSSIAGGTDIISCFVLGNPVLPVRRGEIQCVGLGMDVDIFDDNGQSIREQNGELVCKQAFPSMPVGFWNDTDGSRYRAAYFDRFPGIWAQGDFAEMTTEGGVVIHGRSDAVLNPGGVRIGTAEIYRQVEKLDEILECIAIGQDWDDDVRVVLFVVLRAGVTLTDDLQQKIRKVIRANTTPRHVPAKIIAVPAIPRTISGKIVELAVRSVVHNKPVRNTDALANPEALEHFRDLAELKD
ncbi:acetoacetate--CoA ligase [Woeseia oceani]|uniref:Acetoacetate-CoA ligase n=1 Tax=Woeseia oceani TaxID=1548547 RepID=A0A193LHJ5_9GAMM|nr:acetoacetate--CoA ligase [Woeseia oceani]ANO51859.1 acetoacetate-CoA ligase [Woeseia oceani]